MKYWYYKTAQDTIYIVKANQDYDVLFKGDCIGTFDDPQQAVENLVSGHTILAAYGDLSTFDIPEEIEAWQQGR
ncbi:MAG: hypothetical protein SCALA701_25620 [Candidatus Scalindua sp.]|nr:MAG: hypothetical protein DWQ00_11975 [Candidatus Scalindua sp.]NOG83787.1 hypothetical protein [Planctomycetota bacterium]RZV82943.1 MAG: hypothetical protein EX341_09130 [Candidatus Scalindua sp. SCAELEC01]GJQ59761.1 MAG: hypothetical protein SCALA701_25620 [Candidatus Scalindua sp.]